MQCKIIPVMSLFMLVGILFGCTRPKHRSDYLLKVCDNTMENCGYANTKGDTVIARGKYGICFTDTFRTYAIVLHQDSGFIGIDRNEKFLYKVFPFDNGPDEASSGLFRIVENGKIGYGDVVSGKIVIAPQFDCAWPFEDGIAQVSGDCKTVSDGEHSEWLSDNWFYIDIAGKKVNKPESKNKP